MKCNFACVNCGNTHAYYKAIECKMSTFGLSKKYLKNNNISNKHNK